MNGHELLERDVDLLQPVNDGVAGRREVERQAMARACAMVASVDRLRPHADRGGIACAARFDLVECRLDVSA
jgi:hypothetical protein